MMSFKGHRRRPTSIPAARGEFQGPATPPKNELRTYRAADGQILQSSMVKTGSPSKREITGSISQVRFSLPALDSDSSFQDGDELDILRGFDGDDTDPDDFEKRSIFNLGSRELEAPIRGRSASRSERTVLESMKELLSTSPERSRLFIRGESELNHQLLPIPVELKLPPVLTPNYKNKKRPSSLIFNGTDYEPLNEVFSSVKQATRYERFSSQDVMTSLPTPTSPTLSQGQVKALLLPTPANEKASNIQHMAGEQIEIPDLNKPHQVSPAKTNIFELDNEKEIEHPSHAAQKQSNQLNKRFSFPSMPIPANEQQQRPQQRSHHQKQMSSGRITYPERSNSENLPGLPPSKQIRNQPQQKSSGKGLEIFLADGTLASPSHDQSAQGRFAYIEPLNQPQPRKFEPETVHYNDDHYQVPESAAHPPRGSKKGHHHRRTNSQIIDFPVNRLDEVPQTKEVNHQRASSNFIEPEQEKITKAHPQLDEYKSRNEDEEQQRSLITPENIYSPYDDVSTVLPAPRAPHTAQEEDTSIQSSVDITQNHQDKHEENKDEEIDSEVQSVHTIESISEDLDQLLDLGKLIISTRTKPELRSPRVEKQKKVTSASLKETPQTTATDSSQLSNLGKLIISTRCEPELINPEPIHSQIIVPKQRELPPQPASKPISKSTSQPLGSQHQPHVVNMSDTYESEKIRQISQTRVVIKSTNPKHGQFRQLGSPNPSLLSYAESEISEPFSTTFSAASAQTAQTSDSIHRANSIIIDLTNDNFDITIKKDNRNRTMDQYKSTFDEIDGKYRETIVLDDDIEEDGSGYFSEFSVVQPLNVQHKRAKSALGNLEFEKSNRAFSNFSFETVASEVQLHYNDSNKDELSLENISHQRFSLGNFARKYTDANKSVVELCDDTMKSTREIMDHLKRQQTILMRKQAKLSKSRMKDKDKLYSVRELQASLMKKENSPTAKPRPKSYVYGEDPIMRLTPHHRQESNPESYFDYRNNQSYNFETFMRTQSFITLV